MFPGLPLSIVKYRCVCGNEIGLISEEDRCCLRCGRQVPASAFRSGDQTIIGAAHGDVSSADVDPLIFRQVKHFRILSPLGYGGMGAVYRAVDESLERYVALKVIRPSQANINDSSHVQRLMEEARAQARICHPNVVQVYYVNYGDELPFLAMELVPGETLQERLSRGPLAFAEVVDIAIQTVQALGIAARYCIVHGDIKPANLLMTPEGVVKLSDFGLARPLGQPIGNSTGIAGTPNYLSPEACRGELTDHKSDMYAVGVVLFEVTFGRLPYAIDGKSLLTCLEAHREWPVQFPARWPNEFPREWKGLLQRLLAKNPEERFETYDALLEELKRLAPMNPPLAGGAIRFLAWLADVALFFLSMQVIRGFFHAEGLAQEFHLTSFLGAGLSATLLMLGIVIQTRLGKTIGKQLLQLRCVDQHGLRVGTAVLALRGLAEQMPLWGLVALRFCHSLRCPELGWTMALVFASVSAIDALFAMGRPDGRSFYDLLFRTRVVLDTTPRKEWRRTWDPGLPSPMARFLRPIRRERGGSESPSQSETR